MKRYRIPTSILWENNGHSLTLAISDYFALEHFRTLGYDVNYGHLQVFENGKWSFCIPIGVFDYEPIHL